MLHSLIEQIVSLIWNLWYTGIFLMMTLESSFVPFPSEIAMIPAGYLSSTGEMNFLLAFISWTLWALLWATINYFGGYYFWRPVIKKLIESYGKYFFIKMNHYEKAETYFRTHGAITTFLARFIPAVRQLISIPAGVFQMSYPKFMLYTGIWAGIWNLALMTIGYIAGENTALIKEYSQIILIWWVTLIILIWWGYHYLQKKKK